MILTRIYFPKKINQAQTYGKSSTVIGTCNKTFIQLDLAQGVFSPLFDSASPYFFFQTICCITMKLCMKIASSFKKYRDIGPSHIVIIVMISSLFWEPEPDWKITYFLDKKRYQGKNAWILPIMRDMIFSHVIV